MFQTVELRPPTTRADGVVVFPGADVARARILRGEDVEALDWNARVAEIEFARDVLADPWGFRRVVPLDGSIVTILGAAAKTFEPGDLEILVLAGEGAVSGAVSGAGGPRIRPRCERGAGDAAAPPPTSRGGTTRITITEDARKARWRELAALSELYDIQPGQAYLLPAPTAGRVRPAGNVLAVVAIIAVAGGLAWAYSSHERSASEIERERIRTAGYVRAQNIAAEQTSILYAQQIQAARDTGQPVPAVPAVPVVAAPAPSTSGNADAACDLACRVEKMVTNGIVAVTGAAMVGALAIGVGYAASGYLSGRSRSDEQRVRLQTLGTK